MTFVVQEQPAFSIEGFILFNNTSPWPTAE